MPADVKAATVKLKLLKFLSGMLAGTTVALVLILVFVVLTGENPPVMTQGPVFDPSPGIYEAGGNAADDWLVSGSSAVDVVAIPNPGQTLPNGVEKVIVYATHAAVPGQHRSSEAIDIFDDDKPCGNPCEQTKLQITSRQQFYTSSCMRAIAVGDGMVSSGISSGTYLVRAKPVDGFVYKTGFYSGLPSGPTGVTTQTYTDLDSGPTTSWGRVPLAVDDAQTGVEGWDAVPSDGVFTNAPFIGFSTQYDVAPRHFEVIFTFTSWEDVQAGYVCKTRANIDAEWGLQPEPLQPTYLSGHPRWSPDLPVEQGGPTGTSGDCAEGESGLCQCPESQRVPTPVEPDFNAPHTMRWCLTAAHCKLDPNTQTGTSKANAELVKNDRMTRYWPNAPYIAEFDGTLRAIVVADNYQNSVPIDLEIKVQTVAPVRIYPSGTQAATMEKYTELARKSSWITMTDDIYLWTPTPEATIFYAEGSLDSHTGPTGVALDCPAGACPSDTWTCFSGCDSGNTGNFTRSYNTDIFVKATKIGNTDSPVTQEFFEVQVAKPIAWPKFETSAEWDNSRKSGPAGTIEPVYSTDTVADTEANADLTESLRVSELSAAATQDYVCDDLFISGTGDGSRWNPVCDLVEATDGTADCPAGCTSVDTFTPTCDLDAVTDNSGLCHAGCVDGTADDGTATCTGVADEVAASCTGTSTAIAITEDSEDCFDRYYLDSVQIFIATETPTELEGVSISDCPELHAGGDDATVCPRPDRAVIQTLSECPADSDPADCTCGTNSVGVTICGIPYCPPGAVCPLREKTIQYQLGESGLGELGSFTDYSDATAPRLWESNRVKVKAMKTGLKESEELFAWFRVKLAMPTVVDDADQIDVGYEEERRNFGSQITLETYVTVNADTASTDVYNVGPVAYSDGDTSVCDGQAREECTTGAARHAIMYYSLTDVTDPCDCRQAKGYLNGYGARPDEQTASCNWQVYDAANKPTLESSSDFCTQIVAIDGVSVNSDVAYRRYWIKTPTITFDETNHPIYTSQMNVKLSTMGGSENPEPDTRSIWYVLANPGSDWWTTSDDAEGCLLGGSCAFSEDRVRQAPKACPHWACGAACPQRQDQCPPEEFEDDGSRALVSMSAATANGGLTPTDSRTVYSEGPISYMDLIAAGIYDQSTGALDADMQAERSVQLYDPAEGITLTENKVIFAFSTQENWAISNVAARDYDIRTANPEWGFSTVDEAVPAHIEQGAMEGITKFEVKATTATTGSRVHICRKKRCPMSIQRKIATDYSQLDTACDTCGGCGLIASLKNDVLSTSEFQGAPNPSDDPADSTNDYGQGEVYSDFLESGCMMYFFQAYPEAATAFASCELGSQDDAGGWVPYDVAAEGSYWFTTDVLNCQWETQAGDTSAVAGQAADAYIPATWETDALEGVADANSEFSLELHFSSAVLAYASKRNARPSFFRGQAPREAGFAAEAGPDGASVDRTDNDDWATSYTEYMVKAAAVSMAAEAGTTADAIQNAANGDSVAACPLGEVCVDYSQDVTLTSSTPGARIHYKFFPDYPRENTIAQIPVGGTASGFNVQCGGSPVATPLAGATNLDECFALCVAESESNALVRFCQWTTECAYLDTCESPSTTTDTAGNAVTAAIDWDTMRSSLPDSSGRMDSLTGFSVTEAAPATYGCLDADCAWAAPPMVDDDGSTVTARRFTAADPLTSTDLTLPHSGWVKVSQPGAGDYDELDRTATVQGNTWSHCSQANVVDLEATQLQPTAAGADPLQQLENDITVLDSTADTAGSSCKLHITRSGRLFVFSTRVSNDADGGGDAVPSQGPADNDVGGLQVPSDVTWADVQLKNPAVSYEMRATTCGTTGSQTYCSPEIDSDGRVMSSFVDVGYVYACAGSRVQTFPPLMQSQSDSNGVVVCDQDRDTRIHYTEAQDVIAPVPNSVCEADMEAAIYNAEPASGSYNCPNQVGVPNSERTKIWKGSIDTAQLRNRVVTLRSSGGTARFKHIKAKAVKKFAADSDTLSLTFASAGSLCAQSQLNCVFAARLAQTSGGTTAALEMTKVTNIASVGGDFPVAIPGMNTQYMSISGGGSGWGTSHPLEWMQANVYNEAVCANNGCEVNGEAVPPIPDFAPGSTEMNLYNSFVVDIDLPKAASGVGMVPVLQMQVRWPTAERSEPPRGCAAFAITARQYTGRTSAADGPGTITTGSVGAEQTENDYTALKVKGGVVKTCTPATCTEGEVSAGTCTQACTQSEAAQQSGNNLFDGMDCSENGCDLEAHASQMTDPYREGLDVFLMHGTPIVDGLRYTCQKQDGSKPVDLGSTSYTVAQQGFQLGSWEIFGIKTPRGDYVVDGTACAADEMLDCNGDCRSVWTLGDGVCDQGFNCEANVYDELDCLTSCEETPDAVSGMTCAQLTAKGVSKKMAEAGGYDCSCTAGP